MKIKIYILALDGQNIGTEASWFYSMKELKESLISAIIEDEGDEQTEALKALADGDEDRLDEILSEAAEGRLTTWNIETAEIEVEKAEAV